MAAVTESLRGKLTLGQHVMAPVKRPGDTARHYELARVVWLSGDGFVVDVETVRDERNRRAPHRCPCAVSTLRRVGEVHAGTAVVI